MSNMLYRYLNMEFKNTKRAADNQEDIEEIRPHKRFGFTTSLNKIERQKELIEEIKNDGLVCSLCSNMVTLPVRMYCCQNIFCFHCIKNIENKSMDNNQTTFNCKKCSTVCNIIQRKSLFSSDVPSYAIDKSQWHIIDLCNTIQDKMIICSCGEKFNTQKEMYDHIFIICIDMLVQCHKCNEYMTRNILETTHKKQHHVLARKEINDIIERSLAPIGFPLTLSRQPNIFGLTNKKN